MNDTETRGLLRTIKVPFDIKAIFLGALGYLLFITGGWILDWIYGIANGHLVSAFIFEGLQACSVNLSSIPVIGNEVNGIVRTLFGQPALGAHLCGIIVTGVWFLLIMSVFGGAIARIIAVRIARDESVGAREALKFSTGNIVSYLMLPVFLGLAILFFWACNLAAGLAASIPGVGPIFFIILFPLAILSALIILLIAVGGLLGLFMMVSAVSAEKNGTLDAISRAFSYIYSRPLQFFFYYFLIFLLASIIVLIGVDVFLGTGPGFGEAENENWGIVASSFFAGTVDDSNMDKGFPVGVNAALELDQPTIKDRGGVNLSFFPALGALLAWFFMILLKIGVLGFVVSYIIGGTTAIYFALRRDVDGTEDSEIYVEGAEDEDDFGLPPVTPPSEDTVVEKPAEEKKEEEAEEEEEEAEEAEKDEKPAAAKKKTTKKKAAKKKAAKKTTTKKEEESSEEG